MNTNKRYNSILQNKNYESHWQVFDELSVAFNSLFQGQYFYKEQNNKTITKRNKSIDKKKASSQPVQNPHYDWGVSDKLCSYYDELISHTFYRSTATTKSVKTLKIKHKYKNRLVGWDAFDQMAPLHDEFISQQLKLLTPLLNKWDNLLVDFGGDPSHTNWKNFRPLRLSREEDWSDWLAFLIEKSITGQLAQQLFKNTHPPSFFSSPKLVLREDSHINYRADLIIEWKTDLYTHLEIKVGDRNLKKTFATSDEFRNKYRADVGQWENYILLLSSQMDDWEKVSSKNKSETVINSITWEEVAIALRRCLLSNETILWKSWAYGFIGAIEQLIIGFDMQQSTQKTQEKLTTKLNLLKRGLNDE